MCRSHIRSFRNIRIYLSCKSQGHDIKPQCGEVLYACAKAAYPTIYLLKVPILPLVARVTFKNANLIMLLPCLKFIPDAPLLTVVFSGLFLAREPFLRVRVYMGIQQVEWIQAELLQVTRVRGPPCLPAWLHLLCPLESSLVL